MAESPQANNPESNASQPPVSSQPIAPPYAAQPPSMPFAAPRYSPPPTPQPPQPPQPPYPQYPMPMQYPVYPPVPVAPEARRGTPVSVGFFIASAGALAALIGFLTQPFIEVPFYTPTGMQVAGLGGAWAFFYLVPIGALIAALLAVWQIYPRRPAASPVILATVLAALAGVAPYVYVLARLVADPSFNSTTIGGTTISASSLLGTGFWIPVAGLVAAIVGAVLASFE
jgi:hypothetical protein